MHSPTDVPGIVSQTGARLLAQIRAQDALKVLTARAAGVPDVHADASAQRRAARILRGKA